jgi:predicted ATP-grasp superfamily ATP-dependent carboligase/thymidylate kinase
VSIGVSHDLRTSAYEPTVSDLRSAAEPAAAQIAASLKPAVHAELCHSQVGRANRGVCIALIGPDGAGKTTVGRRVQELLPSPTKYLYMGVNLESSNHVLPTTRLLRAIRRWFGGKADNHGPRDHADVAARPKGLLRRIVSESRACASLLVRMSEEWYRQGLAWYHQRRGNVVLLDRCYFCDYYAYDVDPTRRGRSLARRIHGFMLKHFYRRPDAVILLDAPAEVLLARKGEGTLAVLERRRQDYLEMRDHVRQFAVVDATRPLDQVVADVARVVSDVCGVRGSVTSQRTESASRNGTAQRRSKPTVLVTDSSRGSAIAIIRSLGRLGWRVIAADSDARSPGFRSRYATKRLLYPAPETHPEECVAALRSCAQAEHVDLIIPVSDAVILPLSAEREHFQDVCKLALPSREALEVATDKRKTHELAERLGVPIPRTCVVETAREACEKAGALGWPVVLKPQVSRRYRENSAVDSYRVCYAENAADLAEKMKRFEGRCPVLLQEFTRGEGHGVELLMDRGKVLAAFQHHRLRELPVSGGPSAFRESVPLDPVMYGQSVRMLQELKWTGLAMVEFKVGADGPKLMEINGRVWGSMPLATLSGVDFPARMAELFLYGPPANGQCTQPAYSTGTRARNLELDLAWIASVLLGRNRYPFLQIPTRRDGLAAILDLLNPANKFDIQSWDDPGPGMAEIPKIVRTFAGKLRNGHAT